MELPLKKKSEQTNTSSDKNDKGLAIKNEYSYVVALLMRQTTENGDPDLKLQQVNPNQRNARNVIQGNLQNPNATYLNQLATKTIITKKEALMRCTLMNSLKCRWHQILTSTYLCP